MNVNHKNVTRQLLIHAEGCERWKRTVNELLQYSAELCEIGKERRDQNASRRDEVLVPFEGSIPLHTLVESAAFVNKLRSMNLVKEVTPRERAYVCVVDYSTDGSDPHGGFAVLALYAQEPKYEILDVLDTRDQVVLVTIEESVLPRDGDTNRIGFNMDEVHTIDMTASPHTFSEDEYISYPLASFNSERALIWPMQYYYSTQGYTYPDNEDGMRYMMRDMFNLDFANYTDRTTFLTYQQALVSLDGMSTNEHLNPRYRPVAAAFWRTILNWYTKSNGMQTE